MKRCSLIIHSVSGNIYIIGEYLRQKLVELGERPFRVGTCVEGSGKVVYSDEQ